MVPNFKKIVSIRTTTHTQTRAKGSPPPPRTRNTKCSLHSCEHDLEIILQEFVFHTSIQLILHFRVHEFIKHSLREI